MLASQMEAGATVASLSCWDSRSQQSRTIAGGQFLQEASLAIGQQPLIHRRLLGIEHGRHCDHASGSAAVKASCSRGWTGSYQPGYRSADWVKVKQKHEAVFRITGFEAGKMGPFAVLLLEHTESGKRTKAAALNYEWLRRAEAGKIRPGMLVEVEFQQETPNSYRHPMAKRIVGEE